MTSYKKAMKWWFYPHIIAHHPCKFQTNRRQKIFFQKKTPRVTFKIFKKKFFSPKWMKLSGNTHHIAHINFSKYEFFWKIIMGVINDQLSKNGPINQLIYPWRRWPRELIFLYEVIKGHSLLLKKNQVPSWSLSWKYFTCKTR